MQFGLLYEMQRPFKGTDIDWNTLYKETLEQCALADQMGFDNLWFVEHHFLTGFSGSPCPEVMFGALSQITKRIRIGFGVSILPYHHPVRVAERVAMVDQLTNGRVEVGTGRSNAYEQTGLGIDPRNTRAMWEESISMLPKIWQSDEFSWEGTSGRSHHGACSPNLSRSRIPVCTWRVRRLTALMSRQKKALVCCPRPPMPQYPGRA